MSAPDLKLPDSHEDCKESSGMVHTPFLSQCHNQVSKASRNDVPRPVLSGKTQCTKYLVAKHNLISKQMNPGPDKRICKASCSTYNRKCSILQQNQHPTRMMCNAHSDAFQSMPISLGNLLHCLIDSCAPKSTASTGGTLSAGSCCCCGG